MGVHRGEALLPLKYNMGVIGGKEFAGAPRGATQGGNGVTRGYRGLPHAQGIPWVTWSIQGVTTRRDVGTWDGGFILVKSDF